MSMRKHIGRGTLLSETSTIVRAGRMLSGKGDMENVVDDKAEAYQTSTGLVKGGKSYRNIVTGTTFDDNTVTGRTLRERVPNRNGGMQHTHG